MRDSEKRIGFFISILYRYNQAEMGRRLESEGIGGGLYPYILAVCESPGISQEGLTGTLMLNKSSVARAIAQLEERGFLKRETDPADRRLYRLYPTERGGEAFVTIRRLLDELSDQLTEGLDGEQKSALNELLRQMARNINGKRETIGEEVPS